MHILSDILTQDDLNLLKSDIIELIVNDKKTKKTESPSNYEQASNVSKQSTQEASLPNKKKAKQSCIMAKMFSGLNTHGTIDLTIPDDDEESIHETCVKKFESYLRDAKNGACTMYIAESDSTFIGGGGSRIVISIHVLPNLLGSF